MAVVVAADLRRRILTGALAVGTSITEADLMEQFEISRPTLREALRMLEMEQLLSVKRGSHRGSVVRIPDTSVTVRSLTMMLHLRGATLRDIYAARTIFEPPAARLAAELATEEQIGRLREILDDERAALEGTGEQFPVVGWRFHTELMAMSGNATLAVMAAALEHITELHASRVVAGWEGDRAERVRKGVKSHRKLVDLIARHDGAAAEAHWRKHMQVAGAMLFEEGADESIVDILD
jgi:GntR family transcriptional regulator, transcriptional repressor for pyruvate dehydrogenase complex